MEYPGKIGSMHTQKRKWRYKMSVYMLFSKAVQIYFLDRKFFSVTLQVSYFFFHMALKSP